MLTRTIGAPSIIDKCTRFNRVVPGSVFFFPLAKKRVRRDPGIGSIDRIPYLSINLPNCAFFYAFLRLSSGSFEELSLTIPQLLDFIFYFNTSVNTVNLSPQHATTSNIKQNSHYSPTFRKTRLHKLLSQLHQLKTFNSNIRITVGSE